MSGEFSAKLDDAWGGIKGAFSSALGLSDVKEGDSPLQADYEATAGEDANKLWSIDGENWDKVGVYRFVVKRERASASSGGDITKSKEAFVSFALPIPPQTLMIKPVLPNQVTPTFGGVVEENSAVKFWLMNMNGTMGTAVGRGSGDEGLRENSATKFREVIETTGLLAGTFAGAKQLLGKAAGVAAAISNGDPIGALNNSMLPSLPYSGSAVNGKSNGFKESKEFEKFLFLYQALKAKDPDGYSLYFISHKTDQAWRIAVKEFQLQQNSQNPNLFMYSMSMQGWDCTDVISAVNKTNVKKDYDRFGAGGDLAGVNTLGIVAALAGAKSHAQFNINELGLSLTSKFR